MCTSRMTKIVLSIAAMFIGTAAALAQDGMARGKVTVTNNPSLFLDTWQVMQDLKVAQELQAFLAPLRLPRDLNIDIVDCGAKDVPFVSGQPVKICNELIREIEETAKKISPNDQDDQARLIVGAFIQTALHKTAYGVLDVLQVPVWGHEYDAADRLAALIMVQFGEDIERVSMSATLGSVQVVIRSQELRQDLDRFGLCRSGLARCAALLQLPLHRGRRRLPEFRRRDREGYHSPQACGVVPCRISADR